MEKSRRTVASALLCVLCVQLCLAQHWSYGLQPGGKRSAGDLLGPFQEIANEMEKLGEMQQSECPGSYQNSRIRDLKEAMQHLDGARWPHFLGSVPVPSQKLNLYFNLKPTPKALSA